MTPERAELLSSIGGVEAMAAMLRRVRADRELSPEQLAARTGVAPTYLSSMERGSVQRPRLLTLTRISHAFASSAPVQVAHLTQLAQSYAGEIDAPPLRRLGRDRLSARDRRS